MPLLSFIGRPDRAPIDAGAGREHHARMELTKLASRMFVKLYEDENYLFIQKPSGLSLHSPRHGCPWGVVEAVEVLPIGGGRGGLRSCYPLEKYTSGVAGLAKSRAAAERFQDVLERGQLLRRYVATVRGKYKVRPKQTPQPKRPEPNDTRQSPHGAGAVQVTLIRQYERRAVVRCTFSGRGAKRVRAELHAMRLPVVGDPQFDPRRQGRQAGRLHLPLEQVEFCHPFTGATVRVASPVPASFDAAARGEKVPDECLEVALAGRMPCLLDDKSDTFRLIDGKADGVSGLVAEKFGDVVVLQIMQGKFQGGDDAVSEAAAWYGHKLGARAVYVKTIPRDRSGTATASLDSLTDANPVWGEPVEPEMVVRQDGMHFLIRPYDGYLVGLFLGHRENRRRVRAIARGRRVLNAFAYTCGFSVAAAVGGAASTVSVDVSKKALEWGKRNFAANDISLAEHKFFRADVFDYYKRAERQGHRFDLIILDPPTFSRTKKPARVFQVEKDMARLIRGALKLLDAGGMMLVSTSHRDLSADWIGDQIIRARTCRRCKLLDSPPWPVDFCAEHEMKAVLAQFNGQKRSGVDL